MTNRPHPFRLLGGLVAGLLLVLAAAEGTALTDDAVAVLPAAGTDSANVYSLQGSDDKVRVVERSPLKLVSRDLAPLAFTDFKRLPGGRRLLGRAGDRGVAATDGSGNVTFALGPPGEVTGVATASAAGYDELGHPTRVLYGSDDTQRIAIHDLRSDATVWSRPLVDPAVPAEIVQTIALPDQRVAVAANWPSVQTSGIDIFDLSAPPGDQRIVRFANDSHPGAPEQLVTDGSLADIHDIFALGPDELLVTTADSLLLVSLAERAVTDRLRRTDKPEFAGEFIAARGLPSGNIAAATVEPGLWTRSDPNHRIYWLDADLTEIVARSPSLPRGPWRIEAANGHGGTGAAGFNPDDSFLPSGSLDDLTVPSSVQVLPAPLPIGTSSSARAEISNTSTRPVFLSTIAVVARPGGCESSNEWRPLVEQIDTVLSARSQLTLQDSFQLPRGTPTGTWCIAVRAEDRGGKRKILGDESTLEVVSGRSDGRSGTGRRIEPGDLGLRYAADAGETDALGGGRGRGGGPKSKGCSCRTSPRAPDTALLWLMLALGAARCRTE